MNILNYILPLYKKYLQLLTYSKLNAIMIAEVRAMLENEIVITKIVLALFVPVGQGKPIHNNRPAHGLAYNVGYTSSYTFEGGKSLICHDGECIYLPKGSNYTVRKIYSSDTPDSGTYAINFMTLSDFDMGAPWVMKIRGENELYSLFAKTARAWLKKEVAFYETCFSNLYRIIKQIKSESARYSPKQKSIDLLTPALQYINEKYTSEAISISTLAELCRVSEVYLRRVFQNVFSTSPAVYIRNKRINYAKELLRSEEYNVTDVAMLSGFNDTAYFTREFKKVTGVAPSVYRKEMK